MSKDARDLRIMLQTLEFAVEHPQSVWKAIEIAKLELLMLSSAQNAPEP